MQPSYTTPSSPYHSAKQRYSNNDEEEVEEPDLIAANSRQGYRHSIHGGDVFSAAILEGSMTAGENNASEITVIENRTNTWTTANAKNVASNVPRRGSSSNQSRTSLNSNASYQHSGHATGYQIVVQGVSGPVAHDVHSDHEGEVDDDDEEDCQVSSEDNLSHDSYELIEREGASTADSNRGSKENVMTSKVASPPIPPIPVDVSVVNQNLNVVPPVAFPRMKSNDSFSQESDHNVSINKMARINSILMENCNPMVGAAQMFASDNDDFQGHEVTLQRPPQTPEERMMVDIVRKRGLQLQMKPPRQPGASAGTRSLPRYLNQRAPDLVSGPPPTAYPFGRKHVYNYTSRTLPSNQRRDKSPVYYTRGGLLGPGECSSGSSSSHASPKISRPKSLEFTNAPPNQNASYRDDSLDKQNNLMEYDDSSISGACGGGPLLQYATSSSDVPQTPENPCYPHLPVDKIIPNYNRYYQDEHIYDVPESIEPADVTSPSSSSGITDSFPRPSNLGYDHFQRLQQQQQQQQQQHQQGLAQLAKDSQPPPLPREAPPPLPVHPQPIVAPRFSHQQVGFVDQPQVHQVQPVVPMSRTHYANVPRAKPQETNHKVYPQPKSVHLLVSMSSTESESALSARSAPTPVVGILEDNGPASTEEEIPDPVVVIETSFKEDLSEEVPAISVNLISPPEESESSTAVMDSDGRIPAPPPEFSGAAIISNADNQEATDVDDDGDDNEEEKSGSASGLKLANDPIETATVSQESEYVTIVTRPQMNRGNSLRCFKADSLDIVDNDDEEEDELEAEIRTSAEPEVVVVEERTKMITFNEEDEYIDQSPTSEEQPPPEFETDFEERLEPVAEEDIDDMETNPDVQLEHDDQQELEVEREGQEEVEAFENQDKDEPEIDEIQAEEREEVDEVVGDEEVEVEDEDDKTDDTESNIDKVDDYDNNTMIRVSKEKPKPGVDDEQPEVPEVMETAEVEAEAEEAQSPQKVSDEEEKSPSNGEEESGEFIKIGEMYMRLDNGSTLSENVSGDDDDNSNIDVEEEMIEHYTEAGNPEECVVKVTLPAIQQPEKVFIPSPSPDPSSEQHTKTDDISPRVPPLGPSKLPSLPSLPTGDSASSLGLDLIPLPPPPMAQAEVCPDEPVAFPSPPPDISATCDETATTVTMSMPEVTILPSSPAPEASAAAEAFCVSLPPRALSRISERSNSDAAAQGNNQQQQQLHEVSPRSASPPSEASKGPAEDTMSDQNYASSDDNDNPPSLCSDLPENTKNEAPMALPRFQSLDDPQRDQFPSPPSSLLEGSATIQECRTEVTQVEPDSLFLELSPPEEEEEEFLRAEAEDGEDHPAGGTLERRREKIPYDFSISSENDVTNKEDDDSGSSLHGSMEILEEVATEDHFEHDDTNTDTDDDANVDVDIDVQLQQKDIFEMPPLDAALQERIAHPEQQPQQPQQQQQSLESCDLFELPPLRSQRGNEYIL